MIVVLAVGEATLVLEDNAMNSGCYGGNRDINLGLTVQ